MKYYFVNQTTGARHVVIAKDLDDLKKVLKNADVEAYFYYELKEDTFQNSGFLISDIDKKEAALEVPVQEQSNDECANCERLNKAMDIMRTLQWTGHNNFLSALAYNRATETILIDEESLIRAIQLANPAQKHRKLKLITREEHKKLKTKHQTYID